jgi:hypothetical protein
MNVPIFRTDIRFKTVLFLKVPMCEEEKSEATIKRSLLFANIPSYKVN